jgi:hypothetical protein
VTELGISHGIVPNWLIDRLISNPKKFEAQIGTSIRAFLDEFFIVQEILLSTDPVEGVWKFNGAHPKLRLNDNSSLSLQRLNRPYFDSKQGLWGEEPFEIRSFSSSKMANKVEFVFSLSDFEYIFGQFNRLSSRFDSRFDEEYQGKFDQSGSKVFELSGPRVLVDRDLFAHCESEGEVLVLMTTSKKVQSLPQVKVPNALQQGTLCSLSLTELLPSSDLFSRSLKLSPTSIVDDLKLLLKVGRSLNFAPLDGLFESPLSLLESSWDLGFSTPGSAIPVASWLGPDQSKAFEAGSVIDKRVFRLHHRAFAQLLIANDLTRSNLNPTMGVLKISESVFAYVDQVGRAMMKMARLEPEEFKNRYGVFQQQLQPCFEASELQFDSSQFLDLLNGNVDLRKQVIESLKNDGLNEGYSDPQSIPQGVPLGEVEEDPKASSEVTPMAKELVKLSEKESGRAERTDSKLLRMAENELHDLFERDRKGYLELKRKYIESLNPSQKSMLLEVEKRLRPKVFEDQIRFRLVRYMVDVPDNWRSARSLVQ